MFPLGTVLFPGGLLPLHVFEPRYLTMMDEVLGADGEFGVVLIERGQAESPVNVRSDLGTVARVVRQEILDDGRMVVLGVGTRRIEVLEWLDDDPYPRAMVRALPGGAAADDVDGGIATVSRLWRRIQALASELGHDVGSGELELAEDRSLAVWELCAAAPLGPFDRQRLLAIDDPGERLDMLEEALLEVAADLEARLGAG